MLGCEFRAEGPPELAVHLRESARPGDAGDTGGGAAVACAERPLAT